MKDLTVDEDNEVAEINWKPKKIIDNKPIQVGQCILQMAKLLLCKFVYYLYEHLEPGSFILTYSDTDSIGICLTDTDIFRLNQSDELKNKIGAIFDPLIRPEKKESWKNTYGDWFVVNDTVENSLKPGLLKCKYHNSIFVIVFF